MEWACVFMLPSLAHTLLPRLRPPDRAGPSENGNKTQERTSEAKALGVPNLFSPGNAKGAPGLAFETWDRPSKGQSSPAFTPTGSRKRIPVKARHIKQARLKRLRMLGFVSGHDFSQAVDH
jgi:hypothetical protein